MKRLVSKLQDYLKDNNKTLENTGKELMESLNITFQDMDKISNYVLYDNYGLECKVKDIDNLLEIVKFVDEEFWYETEEDTDYKYVTVGLDERHNDCDSILTTIIEVPGEIQIKNLELAKIVKLITDKVGIEDVKLTLKTGYNGVEEENYINLFINNTGCHKVEIEDVEEMLEDLNENDYNYFLYQLLTISYNVPLKETLKVLKLI